MKRTTIDVSGQIDLSCDQNSPEFVQALEGYRGGYDKTAYATDMLRHVAFYITRFGVEGMVEGVGYVGSNGKPGQEPYSGIMVEDGYDDFTFD